MESKLGDIHVVSVLRVVETNIMWTRIDVNNNCNDMQEHSSTQIKGMGIHQLKSQSKLRNPAQAVQRHSLIQHQCSNT